MYRTRLTTEPVQLIDCAYTWYYGHWYPLPPESLNVTLTRMLHTGDHTISQSVLTTRVCMERAENLWRIALNPEMADFEDVARTLFTTESVDKLRRDMSVRPDGYFAEKSTAELLVTAAAQRDEQRYQLRSELTEDRTDEDEGDVLHGEMSGWAPTGPNSDQRRGTTGSASLDLSRTRTSSPQVHARTGLLKRSNDLTFPEETVENTTSHGGHVKLSPWVQGWLGRNGQPVNVTSNRASNITQEDAFLSSTEVSPAKIFELLGVKQGQKRKAIEMESAGC